MRLLVGNGFDLHHKFPTSYINFLHTIQFLVENYDESIKTVGDVFGNQVLQDRDDFIKKCYDQHKCIYNAIELPEKEIKEIIQNAKNNCWFNYLCECVMGELNWIDFEKEISRVLKAFEVILKDRKVLDEADKCLVFDFATFPYNIEDRIILSKFNFFFEVLGMPYSSHFESAKIKGEYVCEKIKGSNTYCINTNKVVEELYTYLRELANILRDYLLYFVDAPAKEYVKQGKKPYFSNVRAVERVYSFNYTNTFEILYRNNIVDYIHGNTCEDIVLGINPDKDDMLRSVDTTFLQFKKYFQRVFFKTDIDYLTKMRNDRNPALSKEKHLLVIGHSLDKTDEDIIKEIFSTANRITVFYHEESRVKNLIANLVEIYGKEGLDELREEKQLYFLPQSDIEWETVE